MARSYLSIWNRALSRCGSTRQVVDPTERSPEVEQCELHYDECVLEVLASREWRFARRQRPITQIDTQTPAQAVGDGATPTFQVATQFLDPSQLEVTHIAVGGAETVLTAGTDYTLDFPEDGTLPTVTPTVTLAAGEFLRFVVTTTRQGWEHCYSLPGDCIKPIGLVPEGVRFYSIPKAARLEWEVMASDTGDGQILCANADADDFEVLEYVAAIINPNAWPPIFADALAWRLAAELADALTKDERREVRCRQRYAAALALANAVDQNTGEHTARPMTPSEAAR